MAMIQIPFWQRSSSLFVDACGGVQIKQTHDAFFPDDASVEDILDAPTAEMVIHSIQIGDFDTLLEYYQLGLLGLEVQYEDVDENNVSKELTSMIEAAFQSHDARILSLVLHEFVFGDEPQEAELDYFLYLKILAWIVRREDLDEGFAMYANGWMFHALNRKRKRGMQWPKARRMFLLAVTHRRWYVFARHLMENEFSSSILASYIGVMIGFDLEGIIFPGLDQETIYGHLIFKLSSLSSMVWASYFSSLTTAISGRGEEFALFVLKWTYHRPSDDVRARARALRFHRFEDACHHLKF